MATNSSSILTALVPTTALSSVASLGTTVNNALAGVLGNLPQVPQYFYSVPFANNQTVLYRLRIYTNSNNSVPVEEFIFPLTPSSITKQYNSLTSYYDVRNSSSNQAGPGSSSNTGVQRIVDQYGLTPPIITISGTTGFQFHSLDGYKWSGRSSFARLVQFLNTYATMVTTVINSSQNQPVPIMEFADGYTGELFIVVPIGPQTSNQDASRPIIQMYNLQLLVQQIVSGPQSLSLSQQDLVTQFFIQSKALSSSGLLSYVNSVFANLPGSATIA